MNRAEEDDSEKSGLIVAKEMPEDERRLMDEVMESDKRESDHDKRIMQLKTKKANKVLCSISC